MLKGVIKSGDVIRHPFLFIGLYGFFGYIRILKKCVSPGKHLFLNLILPK